MTCCTLNFRGAAIGMETAMNVLLPDGEGPFPVLYLLHGLSDNYTMWQRRTSIERYAADQKLIIVMPDGHRSFYTNDPRRDGLAFENHIVTDIVEMTDRTFHTIRHRSGRAIAGLSMGGYGATMLCLRHPEVFSAASSHSGALYFTHQNGLKRPDVEHYAGCLEPGKYDVYALAESYLAEGHDMAYRLDCGTEDSLLNANRDFHRQLESIGFPHEYAEYTGNHNWAYWDLHVQETLCFTARHFELQASNRTPEQPV